MGLITIDRPERFNSLDVATAQDLRRAGLQYARDEAVRAVVLRGTGGVFCSGADLKYIRARRRSRGSRLPATRDARAGRRLRRCLQADPRVHPQHDLRDPARAEAIHRRSGRHRRGGRFRPRHGLRSRARLRARHFRMGVRQDRADRRRELDVLPAAPRRAAPLDGAGAAEPAAGRQARAGDRADHRRLSRPSASMQSARARPPAGRGTDRGATGSPKA